MQREGEGGGGRERERPGREMRSRMVISHILGPFCYSAVPGTNTLVQHAHAFCMLSSTALLLSFSILTTGFTTVFKYTGAACTRVLHVVPLRASLGSDNCVYAHSHTQITVYMRIRR